MKKLLTFVVSAALLASMLVLSVSAEQTNMEVNVPKFTALPTFDGEVSEDEWGAPTVHMRTDHAATEDDTEIGVDEELGLKNIFYWFNVEELSDALSYDLWLRWDENNFYLAAKVEDPDPFSLPREGEDLWNGDMVQFKIDTAGPSAAMLKADPEFNYKTDSFNGARYNKPWSSEKVFSCILGLSYGTTPTAWAGHNIVTEDGGQCGITCVTHEPASVDEFETNTISYEVAIPWSVISETAAPAAGVVYGMTFVAACSDSDELNAWLQWGHGVCSVSSDSTQPRGTRGGSQAIVLVDDDTNITPADSYPLATTAPETTDIADDTTNAPVTNNESNVGNTDEGTSNAPSNSGNAAPETSTNSGAANPNDDDGLSIGAIIGIIAAIIVVIAVVVVIVVKKKK